MFLERCFVFSLVPSLMMLRGQLNLLLSLSLGHVNVFSLKKVSSLLFSSRLRGLQFPGSSGGGSVSVNTEGEDSALKKVTLNRFAFVTPASAWFIFKVYRSERP